MTFELDHRNAWEWNDAEFEGGDGEKDCSFFPKQVARQIQEFLISVNSRMVMMEMTIENIHSAHQPLAEEMAMIRCTYLRILSNYVNGSAVRDPCIRTETVDGYKWVSLIQDPITGVYRKPFD